MHKVVVPVIAAGEAFTVMALVTAQLPGSVYEIVADPAPTPDTTPPDTVALAVVLVHVPPALPSVRVVVEPVHTVAAPLIAAGTACTVTTASDLQPVDNE
jgi:hypothetical protein